MPTISAAGKRQGAEDPRHLWPYIRTAINIIQPRVCFFENVEGHISLGLSTVLSDLEEDGYTATWGIFSAEEVGAPHRRKRVFILANTPGKGTTGLSQREKKELPSIRESSKYEPQPFPARPNEPQYEWEPPRVVVDPRLQRQEKQEQQAAGVEQSDNWKIKRPLGRSTTRTPDRMVYAELCESYDNRTDELRLLGNGVVPATAALAWRTLNNV